MEKVKSLKATWSQAVITFLIPIFLIGFIRWALIEPFVIPSGSMLPNLYIHDHILVKKFSYGLKVPFTDSWILNWGMPQRGEIAVFKYPKQPSVYYIKRIIGLPGDDIVIKEGEIIINGQKWTRTPIQAPQDSDTIFNYYEESSGDEKHTVRYRSEDLKSQFDYSIKLGENEYFVMGDNRDDSMDSRYWGPLPQGLLVGRAWKIVIGCDETLPSNTMVCNPATIRKDRFWLKVSQ